MSDRLAVPVEFVLAAIPFSELAFDNDGENPRVVLAGTGSLPVVTVEEGVEWPTILEG